MRPLVLRGRERPELWLARTGRAMDRHNVYDLFESRRKRAGINHPLGPHAARHGHAYAWLRAGGGIMDLKTNFGHSSIRTTEMYADLLEQERAVEARAKYAPGELLAG